MGVLAMSTAWLTFGTENQCEAKDAQEYWEGIADGAEEADAARLKKAKDSIPKRLAAAPNWLFIPGTVSAQAQGTSGIYYLKGIEDSAGLKYHITLQPITTSNDALESFHLTCDSKSGTINAATGKKTDAGWARHAQNWHLYFKVTNTGKYEIEVLDFYKVLGVAKSERCSDYRMADLIWPTITMMDLFLNPPAA